MNNPIKFQTETLPIFLTDTGCDIKTLEGVMHGDIGDYIIQGIKGEIYPCKPDIFEATYEAVEPESEE